DTPNIADKSGFSKPKTPHEVEVDKIKHVVSELRERGSKIEADAIEAFAAKGFQEHHAVVRMVEADQLLKGLNNKIDRIHKESNSNDHLHPKINEREIRLDNERNNARDALLDLNSPEAVIKGFKDYARNENAVLINKSVSANLSEAAGHMASAGAALAHGNIN